MIRTMLTAVFLFALWLLMSGVYKDLIVWFGVASSIIAVYVVRRMDNAADVDRLEIRLKPLEMLRYLGWLMVEIAKANWAVTKTIMTPVMPIRQHFFTVPVSQTTELGQTIYANSITLTPGTISVEIEDGRFWVHALSYSDDDMGALADMDARVTRVEAV